MAGMVVQFLDIPDKMAIVLAAPTIMARIIPNCWMPIDYASPV